MTCFTATPGESAGPVEWVKKSAKGDTSQKHHSKSRREGLQDGMGLEMMAVT